MDFKELFRVAKEKGITDLEVYAVKTKGLNIEYFGSELDGFTVENTYAASIRGIYKDKMGLVTIEDMNNFKVEDAIKTIIDNATIIDNKDKEIIYHGDKEYPVDDTTYLNLSSLSTEEKKNLVKNAKEIMQAYDKRILEVESGYAEEEAEVQLINSKGLNLTRKSSFYYVFLQAIASENNDTKVDYDFIIKYDFDFDLKAKSIEVANKAIKKLNAKSVKSGSYDVIIKNKAFASILSAFSTIFSGNSAKENLTMLKDKVGMKIGNELCTIIDDPLYSGFGRKSTFDDEGVACFKKYVIEKGTLKTLLHNLKTAEYFNTKSTGNGFKSGLSAPVSVSSSTLYLEEGKKSFEELCEELNNGLIIDNVQGLHAGLNPISGDFNLQASGFKVENGKITDPVTLIIISSNIYQVFENIVDKGNDLDWALSQTGSPSILLRNIKISGE